MRLKNILNRRPDPKADSDDDTPTVRTPHERQKEEIGRWGVGASELYLCEPCNQVFSSFDVLYSHLWASEAWDPDDESRFDHYRKLTPGDEFPEGATVAEIEPCEGPS